MNPTMAFLVQNMKFDSCNVHLVAPFDYQQFWCNVTVTLCRALLKKQIELLGEYTARLTQDEERQQSHSMASTTAHQGHHPTSILSSSFVKDTNIFQSPIYTRNEPGESGLCFSSAPYSYMDGLSMPLPSVQRDYTPRAIDISYTEGSGDKQWSSTHFAWTKELEVIFFKIICNYFKHHLFVRMTCLAASSGQQQKSIWKPFFSPKSTRNNQRHNEWEWCFCFDANWWWKKFDISGNKPYCFQSVLVGFLSPKMLVFLRWAPVLRE